MKSRIAPLVAAALLLITACGDDDDGDGASTQPPTTGGAAAPTTVAGDTTGAPTVTTGAPTVTTGAPTATTGAEGTAPSGAGTVNVSSNDALGEYLVDGAGMTLYLFEEDDGLTTACTGACADNWPPFEAADPTAGDGVDQSKLETAATEIGENHVAYNGHLLYYFAGDAAPGDTAGHGLPGWYAVTPDGEGVGETSGLTSDPGTNYDY